MPSFPIKKDTAKESWLWGRFVDNISVCRQSFNIQMEESNPSQPRQKTMTYLHRCYSAALQQLREGRVSQGIDQLQSILAHEFMTDTDMENLKYSALMSLANLHEQTHQYPLALNSYWQALQILSNRSLTAMQQGMFNLRQFNEERSHSEFTILLKMLAITQKQNLAEQTVYILKRAITISPSLWRHNLMLKLRGVYQRQNKMEALKDLDGLINNKKRLEEILTENILPEREPKRLEVGEGCPEVEGSFIKRVTLKVNILQKEEHKVKYSSWENLLTLMYVLLKCQLPRGFSKKKYKKLDESREWAVFLKEYHPLRTNIEILLVEEQEGENKMEFEDFMGEKGYQVIHELAAEILKAQFIKKKAKKISNPLEELTRNPSLNSKDPKKQTITQTKSIYSSINEYYKDNFAKNGFKKELLGHVRFLDEAKFNEILGKAYYQADPNQGKKDDDMDDEEEDRSASNVQNKQKTKEKKGPKAKKIEKIAQNQRLGNQLKNNYFQNRPLLFNNIYEAVEHITYFIIRNKLQPSLNQNSSILSNQSIRKCLSKNILKVIQAAHGFFSQLIEPQSKAEEKLQYLDILLQKLQQLTEKDCKSKPFKQHQQMKKQKIISYVKQHFTISTLQTKQALEREDLPPEIVQYYSSLCLQFVRVNHVYGYVKPSQIAYYRRLFVAFKKKLESRGLDDEEPSERRLLDIVDLQIEKYQKKISKLKFIAITEQPQVKSSQSIDEIFKKDRQLSSVLPLLKIFNSYNSESKALKGSEMVQQINGLAYLQSFIRLSEIFNKKLQLQSTKEFNSRILYLIADLMKIKQVIGDIYEKIMHSTSLKVYQLSPDIFIPVLYHLLRIYLLNLYEENDNCIRIIFYISNIIFRTQSQESKFTVIPKCIVLFDELIKYKKFKPDLINIIRKKFYQNLILKNLTFIYQSPLFYAGQDTKTNQKKKKQRKNSSKSQSQQPSEKQPQNITNVNIQTKEKICDVLHDIYFSPQKDRQFNPRKIDQAVGYFMYLLKAYHDQFYCPVVELEYQVSKIIKRCYKIYTQKRGELFQYCQKFKGFKYLFEAIMNGDDNNNLKQNFINLIRKQQQICECCSNLRQKFPYCIESLFLLGKFFESQSLKDDITIDKQQWLQDLDKDENYYFEYLSLNLDSQIAWQNIIRINANKSYMYFDSLVVEPFQRYKGKFLYTKRIIQYINDHLQDFKMVTDYGNQKSQILNAIKIKERQYFALLKEIQVKEAPRDGKQYKEYKDLNKKYKEGLKKIQLIQQKLAFDDVKIRYLRVVEVKMKLFWINLQNQTKQQKKDVIELDRDDECAELLVPRSSKTVQQIAEILAEIQSIINDLPFQEKTDYVIHLQEDLVVEAYMFLFNNIDEKLDRMIRCICESMNAANQETRGRFYKQAEQNFNDLSLIIAFFQQNLLTANQKYKIKTENLNSDSNQLDKCQALFETLFSKNNKSQAKIEAKAKSIERLRQKKQIIIINDDDKKIKQEQHLQELPRNKSPSQNDSSKEAVKNKEIIIDIPKYCTQKIKRQIKRACHKNLMKLKVLLLSQTFLQNIQKTSKVLSELIKFYMQLPKFQSMKRYKNRRSVGNGLLQCSSIVLKYAQMPDKANEIIKQLYNIKTDELVVINIHNEKIATEKNELLAEYYNRVLVHQTMKVRFIQHLFRIYEAQGNKENLVILTRKLLKLSRGTDKDSKEKDKDKAKEKPKPNKQIIEIDQQIKQGQQIKQVNKQKKSKTPKQKDEKQQQIKCYFLLFCQATSVFVNILKSECDKQPANEKYEKNLLQFKHRIRRNTAKNETNYYLSKLDEFILEYEQKYNKKIKMKRTKTEIQNQKEKQVLPPTKPVVLQMQLEPQQVAQPQVLPQIIIEKRQSIVIQQNSMSKSKRKISRKKLFDNSISVNKSNPIKKQKKIRKKQPGQHQNQAKNNAPSKAQGGNRKPRKSRKKKVEQASEVQISQAKPQQ